MAHAPPRNWPHVVVDAGPAIAGIAAGDCIAIVPNSSVFVSAISWTTSREGLVLWSTTHDVRRGDPFCVDADARVWSAAWDDDDDDDEDDDDHGDGRHQGGPPSPPWRQLAAAEVARGVDVGPWRVRFVGDGPPLATIKRFGEHVAVHPHHMHALPSGSARSEWVLPADGARNVLVVEEAADGTTSWFSEPRRIGVELATLVDAAHGALDRDVAAGIARQLVPGALSIIGFDGVVRVQEGSRSTLLDPPVDIYAQLTGRALAPRAAGRTRTRTRLAQELASARAAPAAEIAAVVRALRPDAWAREQALVEECALVDIAALSSAPVTFDGRRGAR